MGEQHTVTHHGAPRRQSPTYNAVRPGSPKESFMTLLLLPQCHTACSTILSTLAWVTRAPLANMRRSNPLQSVPCTPVTASHFSQGTDHHVTLRYG
jgi:hypothetical protein